MKTLIINASHRAGNTDKITNKIKSLLKNHEVKELMLRDIEMRYPDGCPECAEGEVCPNIEDQFSKEIEPTLRDYDTYILATPTWSDNVTPLTLIFWNRIVSWCHEDREYLKDKKLAVITHGMAGKSSWDNVINWVKSVCEWEQCKFAGSFTCKTSGEVKEIEFDEEKLKSFIENFD
jgi:multimeric flavodoxin WrbA